MPGRRNKASHGTTSRVRLVKNGEEFEFEGTPEFVRDMLAEYGLAPAGSAGVRQATPSGSHSSKSRGQRLAEAAFGVSASQGKSLSVGEFIRQLGLKRHTDLVLAFGYYLEKHRGVSSFTAADVNNCYYEAKLDTSNTSQMITQNIKRGFMMPAKGEKKGRRIFTLTRSGEDHVGKALARPEK